MFTITVVKQEYFVFNAWLVKVMIYLECVLAALFQMCLRQVQFFECFVGVYVCERE